MKFWMPHELELGLTSDQLFVKPNQGQEGKKRAVQYSCILYDLDSTWKACSFHPLPLQTKKKKKNLFHCNTTLQWNVSQYRPI